MEPKSIDNRVRSLIAAHLDLKPGEVTDEKVISSDLNADSLMIIDFIMSLEEEFDIEITDAMAEEARTIGDLIRLVDRLRPPSAAPAA